MNHSPATNLDLQAHLPRRIPWARWFAYAGLFFLVLAGLVYLWMRWYVTISVAPDTTVLTTPLLADGYPDYVGYLDTQNAVGVKPEENAWIAILSCFGPEEIDKEVRAEHFRKLGIDPLPEVGPYLLQFGLAASLNLVPESTLIEASVAAQLPWYTRFVRLAAINAQRESNSSADNLFALPPDDPTALFFSLPEEMKQALQNSAQAAADFAEDPVSASAQWTFEATGEGMFGTYDNDSDANFQDLRPEALARIKPFFAMPEEEATWRRELYERERNSLWMREETIMSERPWSRAECPLGTHWIETFSPQLDQLQKELQQRKKMYVPQIQSKTDRSMFAVFMLPAIQMQRQLALSYAYRANLYLAEKNYAAAIDDLISIQQLGALLPQHAFLVEELVCVAIEGIGYAKLAPLIQSPALTDEQLTALEARLAQIVHSFDMVDCLDHGERLSSAGQVVASVVRGEKNYYVVPGKDKDDPHWERKLVLWDAVLQEMNARYDAFRDAAKTRQFAKFQQVEQLFTVSAAKRGELEEHYRHPPWYLLPSQKTEVMRFKYNDSSSTAFTAAISASYKGAVRRDLARVMLALERFRRANNKYPAALTELVPKYLPTVPTDPFDSLPMKYKRTPSGGYRAYSVWQNGIDDGGIPNVDENGDYDNFFDNDLVIGSPDEMPRILNLGW